MADNLVDIIAGAETMSVRELNCLAEMLSLFPVDHPIRELVKDATSLRQRLTIGTAKAGPAEAVRAVKVKTVSGDEPYIFRFADAVCEHIEPKREEPVVSQRRIDGIMRNHQLAQRRAGRGRPRGDGLY